MYDHISAMSRTSNKDKILAAGMQVVHEHGFANASVRDIVQAAGVPQGSFTNHFASKEAFGLEILDRYFTGTCEVMQATLLNQDLPPRQRLEAYIDQGQARLIAEGSCNGCLLGNLTAETASENTVIHGKLRSIFEEITAMIAICLDAGVKAGDFPADLDVPETAALVLQSLQGAILLSKANGDAAPMARFKRALFDKILK